MSWYDLGYGQDIVAGFCTGEGTAWAGAAEVDGRGELISFAGWASTLLEVLEAKEAAQEEHHSRNARNGEDLPGRALRSCVLGNHAPGPSSRQIPSLHTPLLIACPAQALSIAGEWTDFARGTRAYLLQSDGHETT